jgi:hypothetical protein
MDSQTERSRTDLKPWETPTLIIIGRAKPHESILDSCKSHKSPGNLGPTSSKSNCNKLKEGADPSDPNPETSCGACLNNGGGLS